MSVSAKLRRFLDEKAVKYVTITHSCAYTAQEVAESIHVPGREMAKAVIVNADGRFLMVVLPASRRIYFDLLKAAAKANDLRLATEDEFKGLFPECEPGAMPPFGGLYGLTVFADHSLADDEEIVFNAGTHTEAVRMPYEDFVRLANPTMGNVTHVPGA